MSAFNCVPGSELLCVLCHLISTKGRCYHISEAHVQGHAYVRLYFTKHNIFLFKHLEGILSKYQSL